MVRRLQGHTQIDEPGMVGSFTAFQDFPIVAALLAPFDDGWHILIRIESGWNCGNPFRMFVCRRLWTARIFFNFNCECPLRMDNPNTMFRSLWLKRGLRFGSREVRSLKCYGYPMAGATVLEREPSLTYVQTSWTLHASFGSDWYTSFPSAYMLMAWMQ